MRLFCLVAALALGSAALAGALHGAAATGHPRGGLAGALLGAACAVALRADRRRRAPLP